MQNKEEIGDMYGINARRIAALQAQRERKSVWDIVSNIISLVCIIALVMMAGAWVHYFFTARTVNRLLEDCSIAIEQRDAYQAQLEALQSQDDNPRTYYSIDGVHWVYVPHGH